MKKRINSLFFACLFLLMITSFSIISNAASETKILNKPTTTIEQMEKWAKGRNANQLFIDLAPTFYNVSVKEGVDPRVVYAQSAKETNYMKFTGVLDASFKNPCGLKVSKGGGNTDPNAHQRFDTWEEGIRAQVEHLALYAGKEGYPLSNPVDPRHFSSLLGKAPNVEDLGGKWAPSASYGTDIVKMMEGLLVEKENPVEKPDTPETVEPPVSPEKPKEEGSENDKPSLENEIINGIPEDKVEINEDKLDDIINSDLNQLNKEEVIEVKPTVPEQDKEDIVVSNPNKEDEVILVNPVKHNNDKTTEKEVVKEETKEKEIEQEKDIEAEEITIETLDDLIENSDFQDMNAKIDVYYYDKEGKLLLERIGFPAKDMNTTLIEFEGHSLKEIKVNGEKVAELPSSFSDKDTLELSYEEENSEKTKGAPTSNGRKNPPMGVANGAIPIISFTGLSMFSFYHIKKKTLFFHSIMSKFRRKL